MVLIPSMMLVATRKKCRNPQEDALLQGAPIHNVWCSPTAASCRRRSQPHSMCRMDMVGPAHRSGPRMRSAYVASGIGNELLGPVIEKGRCSACARAPVGCVNSSYLVYSRPVSAPHRQRAGKSSTLVALRHFLLTLAWNLLAASPVFAIIVETRRQRQELAAVKGNRTVVENPPYRFSASLVSITSLRCR